MIVAVGTPAAVALVGVLFLPVEIPLVYLTTRRAMRAWRRWAQ